MSFNDRALPGMPPGTVYLNGTCPMNADVMSEDIMVLD